METIVNTRVMGEIRMDLVQLLGTFLRRKVFGPRAPYPIKLGQKQQTREFTILHSLIQEPLDMTAFPWAERWTKYSSILDALLRQGSTLSVLLKMKQQIK